MRDVEPGDALTGGVSGVCDLVSCNEVHYYHKQIVAIVPFDPNKATMPEEEGSLIHTLQTPTGPKPRILASDQQRTTPDGEPPCAVTKLDQTHVLYMYLSSYWIWSSY